MCSLPVNPQRVSALPFLFPKKQVLFRIFRYTSGRRRGYDGKELRALYLQEIESMCRLRGGSKEQESYRVTIEGSSLTNIDFCSALSLAEEQRQTVFLSPFMCRITRIHLCVGNRFVPSARSAPFGDTTC